MNLVKIENKELTIKEWNNQRVVTSWDISELHNRDVSKVNEIYKNNIKKFEIGRDYFSLTRKEFSELALWLDKYGVDILF